MLTFLEDAGAIDLDNARIVFVLFVEAHGRGGRYHCARWLSKQHVVEVQRFDMALSLPALSFPPRVDLGRRRRPLFTFPVLQFKVLARP